MLPENTENTTPKTAADSVTASEAEAQRRDINDPNATFEDLPFKPQLTEKQAKRANQTLKGMLLSIGFCIAVFLPLYFLNPQPSEKAFDSSVDLTTTAQEASAGAGFELFSPVLEEGEYANFARWQANTTQGVPYWEFGVVIHEKKFVWVRQAKEANPTWVALITEAAAPAGTVDVDGVQWEKRTKDKTTFLISDKESSTVILSSDTGEEELVDMAREVDQKVK